MAPSLSDEQIDYLTRKYNSPGFPGSFTGPAEFYRQIKKDNKYTISHGQIRNFLATQPAYYLYRQSFKTRKFRKILAYKKLYCVEIDLAILDRYARSNKHKKYILVICDQATHYVFARAISKKTSDEILKVFKQVFSGKNVPKMVRFDQAAEFLSQKVRDWLDSKNIKIVIASNPESSKSGICENSIKKIKTKIVKLFRSTGKKVWLPHLPKLIHAYNNERQRNLRVSPKQAWDMPAAELWKLKYRYPKGEKKVKERKKIKFAIVKPKYKFHINQFVRTKLEKGVFSRQYSEKYSREVYSIVSRHVSQGVKYYCLRDTSEKQENIMSFFSEDEIIEAFNDDQQQVWEIDKVVKYKKVRGRVYGLVQFVGWHKNWRRWVLKSDIPAEYY